MYFVGGLLAGAGLCLLIIRLSGLAIVSEAHLDDQAQRLADLEKENAELTDDLFSYKGPGAVFDPDDLPYDESIDAREMLADAREQALRSGQFLMVTFGANWCTDCRTLYHNLKTDEIKTYTDGLFHFAHVDVGKFNRNRDVAADLGVDLSRGIPVAIFFDPSGAKIGTTNEGQLERARFYSSKQILKFVRSIAERSLVTTPDSFD